MFDIETGPLSAESLLVRFPFDPTSIKCGNIKDEAKIAEKIEEARASHLTNLQDKAALDPVTGQVLAIGYMRVEGSEKRFDCFGQNATHNEGAVLDHFWQKFAWCKAGKVPLVGFNSHGFDLPFLIGRSWFWHVPMSPIGELMYRNRYFEPPSVDLRETWLCGRREGHGSLDKLAQLFGLGSKSDSGANFHKLWVSNRDEAIAYLKNDLELTAGIAGWMGFA